MVSKSQLREIKEFVKRRCENLDYNHDFEHVERTVKLAEFLAKKENADKDVCVIAAWLHDIERAKNEEVHGYLGARTAKLFLERLGFDSEFIEKVCHAIECHDLESIDKAETIEAKVVFDADKLQVIGPFGFIREFSQYAVFNGKKPREAVELALNEMKRIFERLQTETAKTLASKPYEFVLEFCEMFRKWDRPKL